MGKKGRPHSNSILLKQTRLAEIKRMPPVTMAAICLNEEDLKPAYTFRWDDKEGSSLIPRLLEDGECPQFKDALRIYVDHTAKGLYPDAELRKKLDQFSGREQTDAFKEGIKRWHTFSPSKERL